MKVKSIWGHTQREWGYEVRVDIEDSNGNIFNECLTFPEEPSETELNKAVESLINRYIQSEEVNGDLYISSEW